MSDPLNNSYYQASANAWKVQPVFNGGGQFDVAIIGGGFTGLSAALACAEKGLKVAEFEGADLARGQPGDQGVGGFVFHGSGSGGSGNACTGRQAPATASGHQDTGR